LKHFGFLGKILKENHLPLSSLFKRLKVVEKTKNTNSQPRMSQLAVTPDGASIIFVLAQKQINCFGVDSNPRSKPMRYHLLSCHLFCPAVFCIVIKVLVSREMTNL
jgi:hypothetical protein